MPTLLNGGTGVKGTIGTTTVFITLPTAQTNLGATPTTSTGYTLVGTNGNLTFTNTIGGVVFNNSIIQTQTPNGNLTIQSTGSGALNLNGNVFINGQTVNAGNAAFTNLTLTNLTVTGQATFTSATSTATFAGNLSAQAIYDTGKRVLTSIQILTGDGLLGGQIIDATTTTITLVNSGVVENLAGPGISLSRATGIVEISNAGVLSLTAGTGTSVSSTSGNITIWNTSTLQSVTDSGSTTTNAVKITNATSSTTSTSGALVVNGGIGVGGDVYVAGNVYSSEGNPLYTTRVFTDASPPINPRIGDFWIDPTAGVEYQYVPSGTSSIWIQFIGF